MIITFAWKGSFPVFTLEEILRGHLTAAAGVVSQITVIPLFEEYLRQGYYPFYKEAPVSYPLRLQQIITTVLENDLPAVEKVEYVQSVIRMFQVLERAALLIMLYSGKNNMQQLAKPEKVYLDNTNLMYVLSSSADIGNIRETFFANQLKQNHQIAFSGQGDFRIDDVYTFEVGGKNKTFEQIKDVPNSYLAIGGIEYGTGNRIPLWLFGFLY